MRLLSLIVIALAAQPSPVDGDRVMSAVRAAMAPALPFPDTSADGAVPANGNTDALWMVRPLEPGDRTIEVSANPLNEAVQLKAERAMAQIERNIQAAQRRAAQQYDRAVAEAKRTGTSQEVDGVTLSDEGVAGARIDAESHVTIDVTIDAPFAIEMASSIEPAAPSPPAVPGAVAVIAVPSHVYRDADNAERYAEARTVVFLGRVTPPEVRRRADHLFGVSATGAPSSLVIQLRGNDVLIAEILRKTNWTSLLELIR